MKQLESSRPLQAFCAITLLLALNNSARPQELYERLKGSGWQESGCSTEFWRRAVTVASGHGGNFEVESRQIGRDRCDCAYVRGKPKICKASVVSEAEAVPSEAKE
jgi:hypothetical protein